MMRRHPASAASLRTHVSRETPLDPAEFAARTGASETAVAHLEAYLGLLRRWQPRINLVGTATLADPWRRHLLDSAQLLPLLPDSTTRVADLGSGAGFPGLVLAILGDRRIDLVESDARKCAFLAEAARVTGASVRILRQRIESLPEASYDAVVTRALAPLPELLGHVAHCVVPGGFSLLLKGRRWQAELTEAGKFWKMQATAVSSWSDPAGAVLKIESLTRRDDR